MLCLMKRIWSSRTEVEREEWPWRRDMGDEMRWGRMIPVSKVFR